MGGLTSRVESLFGGGPSVSSVNAQDQADGWYNSDGIKQTARARALGPPDATDEAIKNARMFERRQQLGMQGRMSTFLQTAGKSDGEGGNGNLNAPTTILGA
jgi:hypothetical protein